MVTLSLVRREDVNNGQSGEKNVKVPNETRYNRSRNKELIERGCQSINLYTTEETQWH